MVRRRRADDPREVLREAFERLLRALERADDVDHGRRLENVSDETIRAGCLCTLLRITFLCFVAAREATPPRKECSPGTDWSRLLDELDHAARRDPASLNGRDDSVRCLDELYTSFAGSSETPFAVTRFPFMQGASNDLTLWFILHSILGWGRTDHEHYSGLIPVLEAWKSIEVEVFGEIYESIVDLRVIRLTEPFVRVRVGFWESALIPLSALTFEPLTSPGRKGQRAFVALDEFRNRSVRRLNRSLHPRLAEQLRQECEEDPDLLARAEQALQYIDFTRPHLPGVIPAGRLCIVKGCERSENGIHYTPREIAGPLVESALRPLKGKVTAHGVSDSGPAPKADDATIPSISPLTVCDPACGSGALLLTAFRELTEAVEVGSTDSDCQSSRRSLAAGCLYGVDRDELAVEVARHSLWLLSADTDQPLTMFNSHLRVGNVETFDWKAAFQSVFRSAMGFDVILSNPPFRNVINHPTVDPTGRGTHRRSCGLLEGTADFSYRFLDLAHRVCRREGVVGMLLPRSFLNSTSASALRQELLQHRPPVWMNIDDDGANFGEANVRLVSLVLSNTPRQGSPLTTVQNHGREGQISIRDGNWWTAITQGVSLEGARQQSSLAREFEISASMTTRMAYEIHKALTDSADATGLRLVTTGLIDPNVCLWGEVLCRYLKRVYRFPVIDPARVLKPSIHSRLNQASRPKILVAGVAGPQGRLEAWLDRDGIACGAVSTYTVIHPEDSIRDLERLCDYLNGEFVAHRVFAELHASSLGKGLLTITKSFLQNLPLPGDGIESPTPDLIGNRK